jgi:hypothetical protein
MATFSRLKIWVSNEVLTAADLNGEFDNIINNMTPTGIESISDTIPNMQQTVDPGGVGTESQATTMAGELQRLRFALKRIAGGAQWYVAPLRNLTTTIVTADIADNAITNAKMADNSVGTAEIVDASVTGAKLATSAISILNQQSLTGASGNFTAPVTGEYLVHISGGGGGGGGGGENAGGAGGNAANIFIARVAATLGDVIAYTVGAGGTAGTNGVAGGSGGAGGDGVASTFGTLSAPGGKGGAPGTGTNTEGALGLCIAGCARGGKGQGASVASAGDATAYALGGAAGSTGNLGAGDGGAGGGGGAAWLAGGAGASFKASGLGGSGNSGTAAAANSGAGGGGGGGRPNTAGNAGAGGAGGSGKIVVQWVAKP